MMEENILNISEECEDCFENTMKFNKERKSNDWAVPACIAYEGEPWHYERMLEEGSCPYLYNRLSEIIHDNLDDVKRLWNIKRKVKDK
jgi:hypothetical protein